MTDIVDQPSPVHISNTNRRSAWELTIEWANQARDQALKMLESIPEDQRENERKILIDEAFDPLLVDMIERDEIGRKRYGTPLSADNGRDHLIDAMQEALDMLVYLVTELDQRGKWPPSTEPQADDLQEILVSHVNNLLHLRRIITLRSAR